MRIYKNAWFMRFARKQSISDESLIEAIRQAEKGLIDADLGGGVIKQRLARSGGGKSGGYRTIVFYKTSERAIFVYGFAKSDRGNISHHEEQTFKKAAAYVINLTDDQLKQLISKGQFTEVSND